MNPEQDGITHLNVFSKARTWLGQFLSNFSDCWVETDHGQFRTVEGYWYWLSCKDDRLRETNGWDSKKLGRELRAPDWIKTAYFHDCIMKAIINKIFASERCLAELKLCTLPFVHYYVYGNKVIEPKEGMFMMILISGIRDELQNQVSSS